MSMREHRDSSWSFFESRVVGELGHTFVNMLFSLSPRETDLPMDRF